LASLRRYFSENEQENDQLCPPLPEPAPAIVGIASIFAGELDAIKVDS